MNIRLRHDALLRSLRRNGSSTIDALAAEVGASRRTVLRDICDLRDQGFVIHSEAGARGRCAAGCAIYANHNAAQCG